MPLFYFKDVYIYARKEYIFDEKSSKNYYDLFTIHVISESLNLVLHILTQNSTIYINVLSPENSF